MRQYLDNANTFIAGIVHSKLMQKPKEARKINHGRIILSQKAKFSLV
jgi:hypothetical protein